MSTALRPRFHGVNDGSLRSATSAGVRSREAARRLGLPATGQRGKQGGPRDGGEEDRMTRLVVIDPFFSETCAHASVVLPGSTFAEDEGTVTTTDGRVLRIDQALPPQALRGDLDVLRGLAYRLGVDALEFTPLDAVGPILGPDADYPSVLATGRHRDQYLSGNQTRPAPPVPLVPAAAGASADRPGKPAVRSAPT